MTKIAGDGTKIIHVEAFEMTGGAGDDTLITGDGADWLDGGRGHNVLETHGGDDTVFSEGIDTIRCGAGFDFVELLRYSSIQDLDFQFAGASNVTTLGDGTTVQGAEQFRIEGGKGDDKFTTGAGDDTLRGGDGGDTLRGGDGDDTLQGDNGADRLVGGTGRDAFLYGSAQTSTGALHDTVVGFDANKDTFAVSVHVGAVDTALTHGQLRSTHFDADLAGAVAPGRLGAYHAVLFTADSGDLSGTTLLIVDTNGKAGYQAGSDLVIELQAAVHLSGLGAEDFTYFAPP